MNVNVEQRLVQIRLSSVNLEGNLNIPKNASALVIFAHGSGSSRHSPRNRYVADVLNNGKLATLLFDLLTLDEESLDRFTGHLRFDIPFLAERLSEVTKWLIQNYELKNFKLGYFGASTGAGAALVAAGKYPELVDAVVSRGGRPDLAGKFLSSVKAPTLLIVGEKDTPVISMNQEALEQLQGEKKIAIVPNATHLFPEPGALEEVARLALAWFEHYLS
jgi:putative phosphoribosyl transferase